MSEVRSANSPPVVRRNFTLNVLDGAVFAFGLSFASRSTVLPVYVKSIGGDSIAISLIPVLWILGFNIPQIAVANYTSRISPKKPFFLKTAVIQRLPWLLLAIITFSVVDLLEPEIALVLFFVLFALAAAAGSVNLPVWFDLVAKVTPVRLRGRMFAFRTVIGAGLGIVGGWLVERILSAGSYPDSFALLFGLTFAAMMVSYVFLTFLHEGEGEAPKRRLRYREYLAQLPSILRKQANFRRFLVGESLLVAATMVEAFFVVDAIETFDLPAAYAGRFTAIVMLSMAVGTLLFGYAADRWGHRLNLIFASAFMAIACAAALFAPTVEVYYIAFIGSALMLGLRTISRLPIVAEICGEEDRPTYVAMTNVLTAPFVLAGLGAGWTADRLGYDIVFAGAGALAIAACAWFALVVTEPRHAS